MVVDGGSRGVEDWSDDSYFRCRVCESSPTRTPRSLTQVAVLAAAPTPLASPCSEDDIDLLDFICGQQVGPSRAAHSAANDVEGGNEDEGGGGDSDNDDIESLERDLAAIIAEQHGDPENVAGSLGDIMQEGIRTEASATHQFRFQNRASLAGSPLDTCAGWRGSFRSLDLCLELGVGTNPV